MRTRSYIHRLLAPLLAAVIVAVAAGPAAAADPDTEKPTAPANVVAGWTGTVLTLRWDASTDNVGVADYRVTHAVFDIVYSNTTATNSIVVGGLNRSWTYRFQIAARDAAGNTSASASITVTVPPGDSQAPTTPQDLRATPSTGSVLLQWRASTDNVYVDYYEVVRITDEATTVVARTYAILGPHPTVVSVPRLIPDTEYTLAVRARDAAGNISPLSAPVVVRTLPATCSVDYTVTDQWATGFTADVTVRNLSSVPMADWKLQWLYVNGQRISSIWDAELLSGPTISSVTVGAPAYSTTIPAGGAVSFGFVGSSTATNSAPTAFTVGGNTCSIV